MIRIRKPGARIKAVHSTPSMTVRSSSVPHPRAKDRRPSPVPELAEDQTIFVGGTGRSGTTIMRRVLSAAPWSSTIDAELHVHVRRGGILDAVRSGAPLSPAQVLEAGRLFPRSDPRSLAALYAGNVWYEKTGDGSQAMLALLRRAFGSKGVPVEDSPDNMWEAATLATLVPRSRFIHMVRHPLYVLESTQQKHWAKPTYKETAEYLAESYRRCLASEKDLGKRCRRIRLEDLASKTSATIGTLSRFLGRDASYGTSMIRASVPKRRSISDAARAQEPVLRRFIKELGYK